MRITGKVVAVDFDGTITVENNYPRIGKIDDEAVRVLKELEANGNHLFLYTCRQGRELSAALEVLAEYGLDMQTASPYDYSVAAGRKPIADYYIDDRAFASCGIDMDWRRIEESLCLE